MEAVFYVMAILGCGEGDAPCRELRLAEPRYQSEAACTRETEDQLIRHSDLDYPVVVAQCRRSDAQPTPLMPADLLLPAA